MLILYIPCTSPSKLCCAVLAVWLHRGSQNLVAISRAVSVTDLCWAISKAGCKGNISPGTSTVSVCPSDL